MLWGVLWAFRPVLWMVRWMWDEWVSTIFTLVVGWRRKSLLPPVFNPILLLSASELADNIRERKVSSVEVVRSYVTRISNVNPILNAVAQENFQAALLEARMVDKKLDQGLSDGSLTKDWLKKNQPFLGVPFTVKETIAVAGLPHTGGLVVRGDVVASQDAEVVNKMKKAGAILLANTNISELGMWWESDNRVYGVVSLRGCNVHFDKEWSDMQCAGPLTRHARDLMPILTVLVDLGTLQIFTMENDGNGILTTHMHSSLLAVQRAVTQHFRHTYDCTVHKGEINVWTEITRAILGRARHTIPSLAQAVLDILDREITFLKDQTKVLMGKENTAVSTSRMQMETQWKTLQMRVQRLLGDNGVLLYPSHPMLAPYHSESYFRPLNFTYAAVFNALGFPVTQVPLGLDHNGLPLGIQVVGGMYQDHLTISVAEDLEKAFGGWVCPSKIL
ncbi:Fatty-acid amide hydrolase 2-B-like, partial [Homarus americanus]